MIARFNYEIGKILEHPVVFERVGDRVERLLGNSDNSLVGVAFGLDAFVEGAQVEAVFYGGERACTRPGAEGFIATLRDAADELRIVGLADTRRNAYVGGRIAVFGKVSNVADSGQECGCREHPDALEIRCDALQVAARV